MIRLFSLSRRGESDEWLSRSSWDLGSQRLYYKWTTFRTSWWSHFLTLEGDCSQKWHIRGSGFDLTSHQYCKPAYQYWPILLFVFLNKCSSWTNPTQLTQQTPANAEMRGACTNRHDLFKLLPHGTHPVIVWRTTLHAADRNQVLFQMETSVSPSC